MASVDVDSLGNGWNSNEMVVIVTSSQIGYNSINEWKRSKGAWGILG